MPQRRTWTDAQLTEAVSSSTSLRTTLQKVGLKPAGGNYSFIGKHITRLGLDIAHFKGKAWNKGLTMSPGYRTPLAELLVDGSNYQSYKLKKRLLLSEIKQPKCELCGWAEVSTDGRLPLELDHINGVHTDNRLENLRVLCPNCHSLQPTHRGKNKGVGLRNLIS